MVVDTDDAEGLLACRNDPRLLSGLPGLPYQPSDDEAPGGDEFGDKQVGDLGDGMGWGDVRTMAGPALVATWTTRFSRR